MSHNTTIYIGEVNKSFGKIRFVPIGSVLIDEDIVKDFTDNGIPVIMFDQYDIIMYEDKRENQLKAYPISSILFGFNKLNLKGDYAKIVKQMMKNFGKIQDKNFYVLFYGE